MPIAAGRAQMKVTYELIIDHAIIHLLDPDDPATEDRCGHRNNNIIRRSSTDGIKWVVDAEKRDPDFDGPFLGLHVRKGKLRATTWSGIVYQIDLETGSAKAIEFVK